MSTFIDKEMKPIDYFYTSMHKKIEAESILELLKVKIEYRINNN